MKKLLIASLVLAMVVVFSGVAKAQSWWESNTIEAPVTVVYQKISKEGEPFETATGKFTGNLVANSTTAAQGTVIEEVFMCGTFTITVGKKQKTETYEAFLDFPGATTLGEEAFSFMVTDYTKATGTHSENGHLMAVGTFTDQTNGQSGPAYINATLILKENASGDIESVSVTGGAVGGYAQTAGESIPAIFITPSVSTVIKLYSGSLTPPLTCKGGVVVSGLRAISCSVGAC
jgi:hypothetical protein